MDHESYPVADDSPTPPLTIPPCGELPLPQPPVSLAVSNRPALPARRRLLLPAMLFLATCASTFWTGATDWLPMLYMDDPQAAAAVVAQNWGQGLLYMAAVLGILAAHEMGHFLMAVRYKIPTTLPFFIPVPFFPVGTMGAVIGMQGTQADRRQMFDLGIAGPLAGLVVAIPVACYGAWQLDPSPQYHLGFQFHNPLLIRWMIQWLRPEILNPAALDMGGMNACLMAGWVGMLVTGLNMLPISQLDGGHVTYGLLGRRAHMLARAFLIVAILFILATETYAWVLMLVLVILMGTDHPPTANDQMSLDRPRRYLGWSSLLIPVLCFPPMGVTPAG